MIVLPLDVDPAPVLPLVLVRWRAWEVQVPNYDAPSWHLVGFLQDEHCAKVSSALAHVSRTGDEARSKTGRVYRLAGAPGADEHAARLWAAWQRQHGVIVLRDCTAELLRGQQPRAVRLIRRLPMAAPDAATSLRGARAW
jgi:hypothetical protein